MKLQWQKSNTLTETALMQSSTVLLLTLLFSLSMSQILAGIFYFHAVSFVQAVLLSVLILLVLELTFRYYRISMPIIFFSLLAGVIVFYLDEAIRQRLISVWINFRDSALAEANQAWLGLGKQAYTDNHQELLYLIAIAALTLTCYFIVRTFRQASVMLILLVICTAQAEYQQINNLLFPVSVALFCVIFMLALTVQTRAKKFQRPFVRIVLFLLMALILHATLSPLILYNNNLDRFLRKTEDRLSSGAKSSGFYEFSLGSAGYYPEGSELGGPIKLSDTPFAEITAGPSSMYLRGVVYGEYTGKAWIPEGMNSGLRFEDNALLELRDKTFALTPPADAYDDLLSVDSYRVKPILQPQQRILLGGKPDSIEFFADDIPVELYFNTSGSISADRNIPDEGYQVRGEIINIGNPNYDISLNRLLGASPVQSTARMSEEDRRFWLALPNMVSGELLHDFYSSLEGDEGNSIQSAERSTAFVIKEQLGSERFTYSLDVPEVPSDREFVQWFLEQKSGYCTYFATALTVLCRQAGIPARYVEGYILPSVKGEPGEQYRRTLTGRQAHAWTEIWLDEVGWLPIDATPSNYRTALLAPEWVEAASETTTAPPASSQSTPSAAVLETSSTSEAVPSRSNPTSARTDGATQDAPSPGIFKKILPYLAAFLLFYALIAYYLWRVEAFKNRHDENWLIKRHNGNIHAVVLDVWENMRYLARLLDLRQSEGQTLIRFLSSWPEEFQLKHSAVIVDQAIYGTGEITEDRLRLLLDDYEKLEFKVKIRANRFTWFIRRFLNPRH